MSKKSKRRTYVPQASGYGEAGASHTRKAMKNFRAESSSPVEDIDRHNSTLRQRSRMLYMSSPLATSAIDTNRTKVVGTGLTLRCTPDRRILGISAEEAKAWKQKVEAEFKLWSGNKWNCDAIGINDFAALQQLALKGWLMNGDAFGLIKRNAPTALNPYSLRIHMIEADRISTPSNYITFAGSQTEGVVPDGKPGAGNRIHDGVEIDTSGRVVAYHICNQYPNQPLGKRKWKRVLACGEKTGLPNVLHITDSQRCDQYRGVPYLAPVIETLLQLRRYTEAEITAALVQALFTAWIETETPQNQIPMMHVDNGDFDGTGDLDGSNIHQSYTASNEDRASNEYNMSPGTVIHLKPGEKINFGNPNIPTAGFETFVKTVAKLVGSALEVPYDVLIKEFNSSYSSARGALLETWEAIKMRRVWFVSDFCQPVYEIWLAEAVALGRIKAPGFFEDPMIRAAWCGAQWIGPVPIQLDPKKEASANLMLVKNAIKTHEKVTREAGGGDWEDNMEQLKHEDELLSQLSVNQNANGRNDSGIQ